MTTIIAKHLPEGTLVQVMPDGTTKPMHDTTDWAAVDALTDDEIEAAARSDPDAQPISAEALARSLEGPPPRVVRQRLKLSREQFCAAYQIALDDLIAWESRQADPGSAIRGYMKLIMKDPIGVAQTLANRPVPPAASSQVTGKPNPRAAE